MNSFDKLKQSIQNDIPKMIELETLLSSIPAIAPESNGEGELKKCEALEKYLKNIGFTNFKRYDATDKRVPSAIRPNLIVTIPGKSDDYSIWIMAHLDVVPPGDMKMWNSDPWKVVYDEKTGKLTGRGVEDNQQGLVSGVFAAKSLLDNNIQPEHTVKLLFIADEEFGSEYGIKFLLREHIDLFKKEDLILIPDGGDEKGETIEIAEKSILWLKLHTIGLQSHGSMPDKGKNANLAACALALKLNALENVFNKKDDMFMPAWSTFQPTKKEANVETVNIIPGDDVFYMDCRILPCYKLADIRAKVDEKVSEVEQQYGVKIEVTEVQHEESPATSIEAPIVKCLSKAIKDAHGLDARPIGIGGGTVGAHFRNLGYNVAIWSTMDEVCHQPNEYCYVKNIAADAETLAALFLQK